MYIVIYIYIIMHTCILLNNMKLINTIVLVHYCCLYIAFGRRGLYSTGQAPNVARANRRQEQVHVGH